MATKTVKFKVFFIKAMLALIIFPLFIVFAVTTSPLRIFNSQAHQILVERLFYPILSAVMR